LGLLQGLLAPRQEQKAETGIGASMIAHGTPLSGLRDTPQKRAVTALGAYKRSTYIRGAERAIANKISTLPWWLQVDDERITDESPENLRGIRDLIENPYRPGPGDPVIASPQTFDGLRQVTIRHTGIVGYAFWYLVGQDVFGFPSEMLYINPARMIPAVDDNGALTGWVLDPDASGKGTPFTTDEIVPFYLEEPDEGFLTEGLFATALAKAEIQRMSDQHIASLLATGGRIPGIFHPPAGESIPDEAYKGLVRDMRSILEDPNAAKRTLVLKGAVEFEPTAMNPSELGILEVMTLEGDDILSVWGVPRSQLGYQRPVGLGELSEDKDAEVMWNNATGPRASMFFDTLQRRVIDPFELGITAMFDAPEFTDRGKVFAMAANAATIPMRAVERRNLVGLPPFDDPVLDNAVHLPISLVEVSQAPDYDPGELNLKARLENDSAVVRLRDALTVFLTEQAARLGGRIEKNATHLARKPNDESAWWSERQEDDALVAVLRPHILAFAEQGATRADNKLRGKAVLDDSLNLTDIFSASLTSATLQRLARRVTGINRTTRDRIRDLIIQGLDADLSPSEVGRSLRGEIAPLEGDTVGNELRRRLGDFGSELRAETIARTEMRVAQNGAAIDSYGAEGVQRVEMIDGDQDAECAARDGQTVTLDEAEGHMSAEHPNGTLDFAPVVEPITGKAQAFGVDGPLNTYRQQQPQPFSPVTVNYPAPEMKVEVNIPDIHIPPTEVHVPKPDPVNVEVHSPVISVEAPTVNVEAPTVNVAAPQVEAPDMAPIAKALDKSEKARVKAAGEPQPVYVTNMPSGNAKVKRDHTGRITSVERE